MGRLRAGPFFISSFPRCSRGVGELKAAIDAGFKTITPTATQPRW